MTVSEPDTAVGRFLVARRWGPRRVAVVLVSLTLLLEVFFLVAVKWGGPGLSHFADPDAENQFPALYSSVLDLLPGVVGVLLARRHWAYLLLGLGMVYMAFDEWYAIHERLEEAAGVDWMLLYAPVAVIGAVALVGVVRSARRDRPRAVPVFALGVGCWVVAQALEVLEWDGDTKRPGYLAMMASEELLEMLGSVVILLALLLVAWPASAADSWPRAVQRVISRSRRGAVATHQPAGPPAAQEEATPSR
jgi:hypothetical protein